MSFAERHDFTSSIISTLLSDLSNKIDLPSSIQVTITVSAFVFIASNYSLCTLTILTELKSFTHNIPYLLIFKGTELNLAAVNCFHSTLSCTHTCQYSPPFSEIIFASTKFLKANCAASSCTSASVNTSAYLQPEIFSS